MRHPMQARLVVLAALVLSCGGGGGGGGDAGDGLTWPDGTAPADQETVPDAPRADTAGCSPSWVIEFFGFQSGTEVPTGATIPLQVRIYNKVLVEAVAGQPVNFELVGGGDAALDTVAALTNDQGVAAVKVLTGTTAGVSYTVKAWNPCTETIKATLNVVQAAQGSLLVSLSVPADIVAAWPQLWLEAYVDGTTPLCATADLLDPEGSKFNLPAGTTQVQVDGLTCGPAYTVVGLARNPDGLPVAGGCFDHVNVLADAVTQVFVSLSKLSLDPKGKYSLGVTFDMSALLAPVWIDPGAALGEVFAGAGGAITDKIMADLAVWFPEGIPGDCGDVAGEVKGSVDAGLSGAFPPAGVSAVIQNGGSTVGSLLKTVALAGDFEVGKSDAPPAAAATLSFYQVDFAPGVVGGSGTCPSHFTADQYEVGEVALKLAASQTKLNPTTFTELAIGTFPWQVKPGRFLLFAFVNGVLPGYGFAGGVEGLIAGSFNCEMLVSKVTPETLTCLDKPATTLAQSCQMAVAGLADQFYAKVGGLAGEQVLETGGTAVVKDDNADLKSDGLSGHFTGSFVFGGSGVATFDVPFQATPK